MKGKNVNIYIREPIIDKSKELIKSRKLSPLINNLLDEYFLQQEQAKKREYEKEMKQAYQSISTDKEFKKEKSLWNQLDNDNIWKK
jgi:hypothetical protein